MCNSCNCNSCGGGDILLASLKNLFSSPCGCNRCGCNGGNNGGCGCNGNGNSGVNNINNIGGGCGCNGNNNGNSGGCGCNGGTLDIYYARQYALPPFGCGCN